MNPDRAEEYFCRGCQGENPEDIEFYDEQLQITGRKGGGFEYSIGSKKINYLQSHQQ